MGINHLLYGIANGRALLVIHMCYRVIAKWLKQIDQKILFLVHYTKIATMVTTCSFLCFPFVS